MLPFINTESWSQCIGFSIYAYEGIGLILPVQDVIEDKSKFINVVRTVFVSFIILYLSFGLFVLDAFGEANKTNPLATDFLATTFSSQIWIADLITIFFMINLIFTYPL